MQNWYKWKGGNKMTLILSDKQLHEMSLEVVNSYNKNRAEEGLKILSGYQLILDSEEGNSLAVNIENTKTGERFTHFSNLN